MRSPVRVSAALVEHPLNREPPALIKVARLLATLSLGSRAFGVAWALPVALVVGDGPSRRIQPLFDTVLLRNFLLLAAIVVASRLRGTGRRRGHANVPAGEDAT